MKKQFIVFGIVVLLICVGLSGCMETPQKLKIVSFKADHSLIYNGDTTLLIWEVSGATSVSIDNGIGDVNGSGRRIISPTLTTIYTLTASNSISTLTATAQILVRDQSEELLPSIEFAASENGSINTITILSVIPSELDWSDIELQINGTQTDHTMSGTISVGDVIDITSIAGTGAYSITFKYIPGGILLNTLNFRGI